MCRCLAKAFAVDDSGRPNALSGAHFAQSLKVATKTSQIRDGWSNVVPVEKITLRCACATQMNPDSDSLRLKLIVAQKSFSLPPKAKPRVKHMPS